MSQRNKRESGRPTEKRDRCGRIIPEAGPISIVIRPHASTELSAVLCFLGHRARVIGFRIPFVLPGMCSRRYGKEDSPINHRLARARPLPPFPAEDITLQPLAIVLATASWVLPGLAVISGGFLSSAQLRHFAMSDIVDVRPYANVVDAEQSQPPYDSPPSISHRAALTSAHLCCLFPTCDLATDFAVKQGA